MNSTPSLPYWARHHGALATADCTGLFLGSLADVEVIVKAFVGRTVRLWSDADNGTSVRAVFAANEASGLAAVFYGQDPEYQATDWNDPHQLGYAFGDRVGLSGDADRVMAAFWVRLANEVFSLLDRSKSGQLAEEAADFQCDVLIEEARYALLGMPLTAD